MKSGSESGFRRTVGQILHLRGACERAEPLVEQRVEEAAEQRAVPRAGAADDDHHEQGQREVGGRHLRAGAGPSTSSQTTRPTVARNDASTNAISLKPNGRSPITSTRRSFSRIACQTWPGEDATA